MAKKTTTKKRAAPRKRASSTSAVLIELRQMKGIDRAGREVVFAQDEILVDGVRKGYVGHEAGTAVCLIVPVSAEVKAAIQKAVGAKFGKKPSVILTAPQIESRDDNQEQDDE